MFKTSVSLSGAHNGRLKAYIYIGDFVIDKLSGTTTTSSNNGDWIDSVSATASSIPLAPSIGDRYLLDSTVVGATISVYDPETMNESIFTASGWEAIEYYGGSNSSWLLTTPDTAMTVSIETDQGAIYQYYGSSYIRQSFEQTYPTTANKDMVCNLTTLDGDEAISDVLVYTASEGSYIEFLLNGVQIKIEDSALVGASVTSPCYFSSDFGASHSLRIVKLMKDIVAGDKMYWVGSNAGYQLDTTDRGDWNYVIITAP